MARKKVTWTKSKIPTSTKQKHPLKFALPCIHVCITHAQTRLFWHKGAYRTLMKITGYELNTETYFIIFLYTYIYFCELYYQYLWTVCCLLPTYLHSFTWRSWTKVYTPLKSLEGVLRRPPYSEYFLQVCWYHNVYTLFILFWSLF